jgi:hypothetical protein
MEFQYGGVHDDGICYTKLSITGNLLHLRIHLFVYLILFLTQWKFAS